MDNIDRYLDQACRSISGPAALRRHLRKELKEHLEEAIEELVATGVPKDEAVTQAIDGLGTPEMIREGLQSVYGRSVTSLFVDQAMKWKEKTMTSDWKWNFAAQTVLVLNIAMAVVVIALIMIRFAPDAASEYLELGKDIPDYLQTVIRFGNRLIKFWHFWSLAILVGIGLFEWKCRSDHKALIRTATSAGLSLILTLIAFWVTGATLISLLLLLR